MTISRQINVLSNEYFFSLPKINFKEQDCLGMLKQEIHKIQKEGIKCQIFSFKQTNSFLFFIYFFLKLLLLFNYS